MYCGKCGNKLTEDARFCAVCGAPIPTHLQGRGTSRYYDHPERQSSSNPRVVHNPQFQPKNTPKTDSRAQGMYQAGNGTDRICPVCGRNVPWNLAGCVCGYPYRINPSFKTVQGVVEDTHIQQHPEQPIFLHEPQLDGKTIEPEQSIYDQESGIRQDSDQPAYIRDATIEHKTVQQSDAFEIPIEQESDQSVFVHEVSSIEQEFVQPEFTREAPIEQKSVPTSFVWYDSSDGFTEEVLTPEFDDVSVSKENKEKQLSDSESYQNESNMNTTAVENNDLPTNSNAVMPPPSYVSADVVCPLCGRKVEPYASYCICGHVFAHDGVLNNDPGCESAFLKEQTGLTGLPEGSGRYCKGCGKLLTSDERFCERCGTVTDDKPTKMDPVFASDASVESETTKTEYKPSVAVNRKPYIPAPGEEDKDRAAQVLKSYHKEDPNSPSHPYKKLGGFLLYDVVTRIIALILELGIGVFELVVYNEYRYLWRWFLSFLPRGISDLTTAILVAFNVLVIIYIIMDLVQVVLIMCRSKWFLLFYQLTYISAWLTSATMLAITIIMFSQYTRIRFNFAEILPYIIDFVRINVTIVLWSHYYSHSVRVRVYMGSSDYLRKSIFNRRTKSPVPEFDENGYDIG